MSSSGTWEAGTTTFCPPENKGRFLPRTWLARIKRIPEFVKLSLELELEELRIVFLADEVSAVEAVEIAADFALTRWAHLVQEPSTTSIVVNSTM